MCWGLKITDIFGRETKEKSNTTLFYIYENGKVLLLTLVIPT